MREIVKTIKLTLGITIHENNKTELKTLIEALINAYQIRNSHWSFSYPMVF